METYTLVHTDLIDPNPYQPRHAEDLAVVKEIAESIKRFSNNGTMGLLQVPSARQVDGRYQLAFGHTRLAAFKLNGEECMPLVIRDLSNLEMFELGVTENIKRRDLNVVEQAEAMRRYMDEFNKSSVEAGEFFNVSPESVRSTIRYLNLPTDVQAKLASGAITQTTARSLLSMQKAVPDTVLTETAELIEKGKNKWGGKATPDEIIEDVMDELMEEAKPMWQSWQKGNPRGGSSDAWELNMKKFPNQFLPVLTAVDAAIALGIQDDEEMMEKVATWIQASIGELPDLDVQSLGIPEDLLKKLNHLISPPACTACPFYTVVQGTHYCGMEVCFTRKTRAWDYEKLRAASTSLKIEIYNRETDGSELRLLEESWSDNGKKHMELFRKRSKDLRLALAVDIGRKKPQSGYEGVPGGSVVMLVGKSLKTLLEAGQKERAAKRSKEQAAALLARLLEEKRAALDWELANHVKLLFAALNMAALEALWKAPGRYSGGEWEFNRYTLRVEGKPGKDAPVAEQEDYLRQVIALNMIKKIGGYYKKSITEYAESAGKDVKSWGVKLPKSILKLAAQMDKDIETETAEDEE